MYGDGIREEMRNLLRHDPSLDVCMCLFIGMLAKGSAQVENENCLCEQENQGFVASNADHGELSDNHRSRRARIEDR